MKEFAGLTSVRRAMIVASALAAVMCTVPAGASAVELACGDTITPTWAAALTFRSVLWAARA
jgi:hypothetical protein